MVGGVEDASPDLDPAVGAIFGMGGRREVSASGAMPARASGVQGSSMGAGSLVLVARELTGLLQRRLAQQVGTSQPSLAKIESGSRIPTLSSMLRVAAAAGYELVLGLVGADEDPPHCPPSSTRSLSWGVLRPNPEDDLADFVVFKEPSVFDGPKEL